ncbi:MAG: tol-pal system protein YbgF [Roseovarius sp.]
MRRLLLIFTLIFVAATLVATVGRAQSRDETLADIRQQLSVLYVEIQRLNRELSTTGGVGDVSVGGSVLERVAALESEVQRLTAKTEELEFRIDSVVRDGTNRLGDLEFRLCELEADCDIAQLSQGSTLGGIEPATSGQADTGSDSGTTASTGMELAVGEQADFDMAAKMLEEGDFSGAAEQFAAFIDNYPGSPLAAEAGLQRGQALERSGATTQAARAYLDTFSAAPNGPKAPEALYRLGRALGQLGQRAEACVTLSEVGARFPGTLPAADARAEMQALGCQ